MKFINDKAVLFMHPSVAISRDMRYRCHGNHPTGRVVDMSLYWLIGFPSEEHNQSIN
jgi:hypothetical protein